MDLVLQLIRSCGLESPTRATFLLALAVLAVLASALKREWSLSQARERELEAYHALHLRILDYLITKGERHEENFKVVDQPPTEEKPDLGPPPPRRLADLGPCELLRTALGWICGGRDAPHAPATSGPPSAVVEKPGSQAGGKVRGSRGHHVPRDEVRK